MTDQLNNFALCVKNIPQLRKAFISCKDLEESYNKFKIMLNGCTFIEYKKFFEGLAKDMELLSNEDLLNVTGGLSIKRLITPLTVITMLTGMGSNFSFAGGKDLEPGDSSFAHYERCLDEGSTIGAAEEIFEEDMDFETLKNLPNVTESEIEFGLKVVESMPKKGDPDFEKFLKLPNQSKLNEAREITINYKDAPSETKIINEKEIYKEIEKTVKELITKVENETSFEDMNENEIESKTATGELSKNYKKSKQMRIANEIYRWVTKNIKIDHDSDISNSEDDKYRKDQDAISVFYHKMAVCQGNSRLINLMMKMAKIPSAYIESGLHAFNVVYLENEDNNESGWALMDAMWGAQLEQGDIEKPGWNVEMFFPAFYNTSGSLKEANRSILKHDYHHVMDIATATDLAGNLEDEYWYNFKINNVEYCLYGADGEGLIGISGDNSNPIENLVIPEEISNFNLPFRINDGIKSINLNGSEYLIGTDATFIANDLEFIQFGNIKCSKDLKNPFIWSDMDTPIEKVRIPDTLLRLNVPIQVGFGIKSIVLTGDEIIDISRAGDLESIDATNSNRYVVEDGILYEKTESGEKGEQITKIGETIFDRFGAEEVIIN